MMFAQQPNNPTMHFSGHIPIVKRRMTVPHLIHSGIIIWQHNL